MARKWVEVREPTAQGDRVTLHVGTLSRRRVERALERVQWPLKGAVRIERVAGTPHGLVARRFLSDRSRQFDVRRAMTEHVSSAGGRLTDVVSLPAYFQWDPQRRESLVAEFALDAVPLREFFNDDEVPARLKVNVARRVMKGLARVHASGVVHDDPGVKNWVVDRQGNPRLVDFESLRRTSDAPVLVTTRRLTPNQEAKRTSVSLAPYLHTTQLTTPRGVRPTVASLLATYRTERARHRA